MNIFIYIIDRCTYYIGVYYYYFSLLSVRTLCVEVCNPVRKTLSRGPE